MVSGKGHMEKSCKAISLKQENKLHYHTSDLPNYSNISIVSEITLTTPIKLFHPIIVD